MSIDSAIDELRQAIHDAMASGAAGGAGTPTPGAAGAASLIDKMELQSKQLERQLDLSLRRKQTDEEIKYQIELQRDLTEQQARIEYEQAKINGADLEVAKDKLATILSQLEEEKRISAEKEKQLESEKKIGQQRNKNFKEGLDFTNKWASTLTGIEKHPLFNTGKLIQVGKAVAGLFKEGGGGFKGLASFVGGALLGAFSSFLNLTVSLIFQVDKFEKGIRKATDGTGQYARAATSAFESNRAYGVSMENTGAAATALFSTMTNLSMESKATQKAVIETTSVLVQMGVSANDAAHGMQFANKVLGQTPTGATATLRDLEATARDLGVPVNELFQNFSAVSGELAKLGPTAVDSFKELSRVSKITGLDVKKLLALTDKFDTFEGAATMAGKLNAALGGNFVNAMDMMQATDPVERFEMLRGALDEAGLTFDNMTYYQRKFYAEQMGMSVEDLALAMAGDMGELGDEVGRTSSDYVDMAERAREMGTFQEKLQATFMKFIPILTPLIDKINVWLDALGGTETEITTLVPWLEDLAEIFEFIAYVITDILMPNWEIFMVLGVLHLTGLLGPLIAKIGTLAMSLLTRLIPSLAAVGTTTTTTSATMAPAVPIILAVGAAFLMMGLGIGIAATGVAILVTSLTQAGELLPMILGFLIVASAVGLVAMAALYGLASSLIAAGAGATFAIGPLLGVGAAFLMIGLAIGAAALGMALLIDSLVLMANAESVESLLGVSTAITSIGAALLGAIPAVWGMSIALAALMPSLEALDAIGVDVSSLFGGGGDTATDAANAAAVVDMAEAMENIDPEAPEVMADSMDRMVNSINRLDDAKAKDVTEVLENAIQYSGQVMAARTGAAGNVGRTIRPAANQFQMLGNVPQSATQGSDRPYEVTIKLELDGEVLSEKVVGLIGGQSGVIS